jgi:hypothetical protein
MYSRDKLASRKESLEFFRRNEVSEEHDEL